MRTLSRVLYWYLFTLSHSRTRSKTFLLLLLTIVCFLCITICNCIGCSSKLTNIDELFYYATWKCKKSCIKSCKKSMELKEKNVSKSKVKLDKKNKDFFPPLLLFSYSYVPGSIT